METLLKNSSMEMLREYYFDVRGEYPPIEFTRCDRFRGMWRFPG